MSDDEDDESSNVVEFIRKTTPVARRMTSAAILDGLELSKLFFRIRSAAERKRILRMVREIVDSDANKRT
ncbi:hypothetical protein [Bradyrhizobium sp.]